MKLVRGKSSMSGIAGLALGALILMAPPALGSGEALRPLHLGADCGYVFNPYTGTPPGFDAMAAQLITLLQLAGLDLPISSWEEADLEMPDYYSNDIVGDGIPDSYELAMLGAALCVGDPLIVAQFNANRAAILNMMAQLHGIADAANQAYPLLLPAVSAINDWADTLPDGEVKDLALDTSGKLGETQHSLQKNVIQYLPLVLTMLPSYTNWFTAVGGMNTGLQNLLLWALFKMFDQVNSTCPYNPVSITRLTIEAEGLNALAASAQPPMTPELATQCSTLANVITSQIVPAMQALQMPSMIIYGSARKVSEERFSATGDYNGDGLTNKEAYDLVTAAGGNRSMFVQAAGGNNPLWTGNPALPVGGGAACIGLAGACLGFGARVLKRRDEASRSTGS